MNSEDGLSPKLPDPSEVAGTEGLPWMLNTPMSLDQQREHLRRGLHHQQALEHIFKRQEESEDPDGAAMLLPQTALLEVQQHLAGLADFFRTFLGPVFYNERHCATPTVNTSISVAQKVFGVNELLELILGFVAMPDILAFQQVNRSSCLAIENSTELQRKLSLLGDHRESSLRLPFAQFSHGSSGGFFCGSHWEPMPEEASIKAGFANACAGLPRIGAKWRRMYICQPPLTEMDAFLPCCGWVSVHSSPAQAIQSSDGITMGAVWDATKFLIEQHRLCPHAEPLLHDEEGLVRFTPVFHGNIRIKAAEEVRHSASPTEEPICRMPSPFNPLSDARIQAYVDYKRRGKPRNTAHFCHTPALTIDSVGSGRAHSDSCRARIQCFEGGLSFQTFGSGDAFSRANMEVEEGRTLMETERPHCRPKLVALGI